MICQLVNHASGHAFPLDGLNILLRTMKIPIWFFLIMVKKNCTVLFSAEVILVIVYNWMSSQIFLAQLVSVGFQKFLFENQASCKDRTFSF